MAVAECCIGLQEMTADAACEALKGDQQGTSTVRRSAIQQLRSVAGLCNAGEFDAATMDLPLAQRKIHGDATDQAILRFSEGMGPISELKRTWNTKFNLAFNSKNKFMIRVLGLTNRENLENALPFGTAAIFEPGDM